MLRAELLPGELEFQKAVAELGYKSCCRKLGIHYCVIASMTPLATFCYDQGLFPNELGKGTKDRGYYTMLHKALTFSDNQFVIKRLLSDTIPAGKYQASVISGGGMFIWGTVSSNNLDSLLEMLAFNNFCQMYKRHQLNTKMLCGDVDLASVCQI